MNYAGTILAIVLPQVPYYLLILIGLGIAIFRSKHHPRVSLLAGIYFLGDLILGLVGLGFSLVPMYLLAQGLSVTEFSTTLGIVNIVTICLRLILTIILLFAIFGWRTTPKPVMTTDIAVQ